MGDVLETVLIVLGVAVFAIAQFALAWRRASRQCPHCREQ